MYKYKYPVVLSIAGSDSVGGAGIQADLKTISALGCFGTTAITAITAQNTLTVSGIHPVPVDIVKAQIKAVMDDIKPAAIKIGMVHSATVATAIAETLSYYPNVPVIFDPVMVATSGDRLITNDTIEIFKQQLFPLAELVTPNLDEAAILAGMAAIKTIDAMKEAAVAIMRYKCKAVLIKGGHLKGADLFDIYLDKNGQEYIFQSTAIDTINTHGTGCSLSSAIASFIALGNDLHTSISKGKEYIQQAIAQGKDVKTGEGHGPLNHFFKPQKLIKLQVMENQITPSTNKITIPVHNAGLVLFYPYMPMLFQRLDLMDSDHRFVNEAAQLIAVHCLQYLVSGGSSDGNTLPLNKVLCGLSPSMAMPGKMTINAEYASLMNGMIHAAIEQWPAMGNSSIDGFRGNWLVRDGSLIEQEAQLELVIEKRAYDVLIDTLPFSFAMIKYPWMHKPLHVSWPY
jgi:hydroxymethylpyrimidine/phosphomethylpyrimidine kinase